MPLGFASLLGMADQAIQLIDRLTNNVEEAKDTLQTNEYDQLKAKLNVIHERAMAAGRDLDAKLEAAKHR